MQTMMDKTGIFPDLLVENPLDARVRLVNLDEVRTIFETYDGQAGNSKDNEDEDEEELRTCKKS